MNVNEKHSAAAVAGLQGQPSPQRRVVALTEDPALSQALEALAAMNVAVVQVPTRESLAEELVQADPVIALIDAACVERQIETLVDHLHGQFPDLRIIVAGHSLEQNVLATRIAQGAVFRFLHKPASAQRLKLFVDAANRPSENTRSVPVLTMPDPVRESGPRLAAAGPEGPRRGPGGLPLPLIAGAALAVVAVAGGWLIFGGDDAPPAPTSVASSTVPSAGLEAAIRSADQAFAAQRFVGRNGDSAAELYQVALQMSPQDARARSGFTRSVDFALRNAEAAFNDGRYTDAGAAVDALQAVSPRNSRLTFLSTQLQRERERSAADENRRLGVEARQDRLRTVLQQANDRIRRGTLLGNNRTGALDSLATAQELAPGDPDVRSLRELLATRLVDSASQKLDGNDAIAARPLIDAAAGIGADPATLTRLRRRADDLSLATAAPREARTPTADAPAPVVASAAPPSVAATTPTEVARAAGPRIYNTKELTLMKKVELDYPKRALDSATSGWVDVEFTIAIDGSVRNVAVLNSEPRNVFDQSATQGLRRWRYKPVVENGEVVEARSRMRLRFSPQSP